MNSTYILSYLLPFVLVLVDLVVGAYATKANHRYKRESLDEQPKEIEEETLGLDEDHNRAKRGMWWPSKPTSSACAALCGYARPPIRPADPWRSFGGWNGGGGGGGFGPIYVPGGKPPGPGIWGSHIGLGVGDLGGSFWDPSGGDGGFSGGNGGWDWKRRR